MSWSDWGFPRDLRSGRILAELLETVLDDPAQNERERLLEIAARVYRERIEPGTSR